MRVVVLQQCLCAQIKQLNGSIATGARETCTVRMERNIGNNATRRGVKEITKRRNRRVRIPCVISEAMNACVTFCVPNTHGLIVTTASNESSVGREYSTADPVRMTTERIKKSLTSNAPHLRKTSTTSAERRSEKTHGIRTRQETNLNDLIVGCSKQEP